MAVTPSEKVLKLEGLVRNKLSEYFGDKIVDVSINPQGELVATVDRSVVRAVNQRLRDDPDFRFDCLAYETAIDNSARDGALPRFSVIYQLLSLSYAHRIRVKAHVPENDPCIDSMVTVWPAADWLERECFDMFGILFKGHPDLRRILMPEDWEGHPLRKDFPLGGVKSFYFKRSTEPRAGEPKGLIPRIREQRGDI